MGRENAAIVFGDTSTGPGMKSLSCWITGVSCSSARHWQASPRSVPTVAGGADPGSEGASDPNGRGQPPATAKSDGDFKSRDYSMAGPHLLNQRSGCTAAR